MAVNRMAGSQEFKQKMNTAVQGRMGGKGKPQAAMQQSAPANEGSNNDNRGKATLFGADAYDRQVRRESAAYDNNAISGSRNAENIAAYAQASKAATAANGDFSIDSGNKWVNNAREQSNTNKEQDAGFTEARRSGNVDFANQQRDNNVSKNEGFAMNMTNDYINRSRDLREDNTAKATAFADQTVDKYIQKNKDTQAINVGALDQAVRGAAIVDKSYSTVQGLNTYGDMYRYGREKLPVFNKPTPAKPVEKPDFQGMYNDVRDDISNVKIKG